jgi:hypothetical protein
MFGIHLDSPQPLPNQLGLQYKWYGGRSNRFAASVARQHDPIFKALYEKKRAEGKTYTVAVCIVARKMLTVIRAIWLGDVDCQLPETKTT